MAIDWDAMVIAPVMAVFGESVLYAPAAGGSFTITGVYDEAYRRVDFIDGDVPVTSEMPVLGVRLAEFSSDPVQGDQLTIVRTGETFQVKEFHPDGHGEAKLLLNLVAA